VANKSLNNTDLAWSEPNSGPDINAISRFKAMDGLNPQVKRKILSDNPDDSTGFEAS
jgi:hypothetical protein